jgi:hypothetical protein
MFFHRARNRVWGQVERWQRRLGRNLVVATFLL